MMGIKRGIDAAALEEPRRLEDGELVGRYRFSEDFQGFAGHFPGAPIVPAVVQLRTVQALFERAGGRSYTLLGVDNAKFLLQLRPLQEIEVFCRERQGGREPVVEGKLRVQGALAASFILRLAAAGEEQ
jgi:3-hydroxyacyl-[acyl-carrier-protein] dehydratase